MSVSRYHYEISGDNVPKLFLTEKHFLSRRSIQIFAVAHPGFLCLILFLMLTLLMYFSADIG